VNPVEPPISSGGRGPLIADLHAALRAMIGNGYRNAPAFTAGAQDVIQRGLPAESGAACYGPAAQLFIAGLQGFIGAGDATAILAAGARDSLRSGRQTLGSIRYGVEAVEGCGFRVDDVEAGAVVRLAVTDTPGPAESAAAGENDAAPIPLEVGHR
jgi:hypothetical protein